MKEFRTGNAIVRIHGSEPENLKAATETFMKKVFMERKKANGQNAKKKKMEKI